jgi:hypothetical protein
MAAVASPWTMVHALMTRTASIGRPASCHTRPCATAARALGACALGCGKRGNFDATIDFGKFNVGCGGIAATQRNRVKPDPAINKQIRDKTFQVSDVFDHLIDEKFFKTGREGKSAGREAAVAMMQNADQQIRRNTLTRHWRPLDNRLLRYRSLRQRQHSCQIFLVRAIREDRTAGQR